MGVLEAEAARRADLSNIVLGDLHTKEACCVAFLASQQEVLL